MNRRKASFALAFTLIFLVVCNIVFFRISGWYHLWLNIVGLVGLFGLYKFAGLTLEDIGLERTHMATGLKYGAICMAIILCGLLLVYALDAHAFRDARYHQSVKAALLAALILEPLKTVLFEELAFRGILPAILLRVNNQKWFAIIASSVTFGLWHVSSSTAIGNYHLGSSLVIGQTTVVAATVIFTTLAGIILCELRLRSKSLLAPIIVHWFVDGMTIVLAAFSWR